MVKVTSALSREGVSCEASNIHGKKGHVFHFGSGGYPRREQRSRHAGGPDLVLSTSSFFFSHYSGPSDCPGWSGCHGCSCQRRSFATRGRCFLLHETQRAPWLLPASRERGAVSACKLQVLLQPQPKTTLWLKEPQSHQLPGFFWLSSPISKPESHPSHL